MSLCKIVKVKSDYNFYGRLVPLICEEGGIVEDTQFTDNVEVTFRIPQDKVPFFESRNSKSYMFADLTPPIYASNCPFSMAL